MLAATTCSSVGLPAARREKRVTRGRTARMRASPPAGAAFDDHPVADGGKIGAACGVVTQPPGHARELLARRRHDAVDVRVLEADPRRLDDRGARAARTPPRTAADQPQIASSVSGHEASA